MSKKEPEMAQKIVQQAWLRFRNMAAIATNTVTNLNIFNYGYILGNNEKHTRVIFLPGECWLVGEGPDWRRDRLPRW